MTASPTSVVNLLEGDEKTIFERAEHYRGYLLIPYSVETTFERNGAVERTWIKYGFTALTPDFDRIGPNGGLSELYSSIDTAMKVGKGWLDYQFVIWEAEGCIDAIATIEA